MTTDCDFVLAMLEQGPATTMMLIRQSINARGCGLTPHSRVADLRRDGYDIRCERVGSHNGRGIYQYTLVEDAGFVEPPARGHAAQGREIPAPVPDVIPGQLRLVG